MKKLNAFKNEQIENLADVKGGAIRRENSHGISFSGGDHRWCDGDRCGPWYYDTTVKSTTTNISSYDRNSSFGG